MGIWDSVRSTVDKVTGSSAQVSLEADADVIRPGQTVNVRIAIKNGLSALQARAVLLEIEAIEAIDLPRHASWVNIVEDVAANRSRRGEHQQAHGRPAVTRHSDKTWSATVTVSPALSLAVGEEKRFQGTFRLPGTVQPTYKGKYAHHSWRMRARLDVFGTDPSTPWTAFRVVTDP